MTNNAQHAQTSVVHQTVTFLAIKCVELGILGQAMKQSAM